jgi:hypothetical protein
MSESTAATSYAVKYIDTVHSIDARVNYSGKKSHGPLGTEFIDPNLYYDSTIDTKKKRALIRQIVDSKKADIFKFLDSMFASIGFKSVSLIFENDLIVIKSSDPDRFQYSEELFTNNYPLCMLEYSNPLTGNFASYVITNNEWNSVHTIHNYDQTWNYELLVQDGRVYEISAQKKSGGGWINVSEDSKAWNAIYNKVYGSQFSTTSNALGLFGKDKWRKRANNVDPNYEYYLTYPDGLELSSGIHYMAKARNIKTKEIFDLDKLAAKNPKFQKTIDIIAKEWPTMVES